MRPPKSGSSIVAAVAALSISAVAAAQTRRPDAGNIAADEEALRSKNAREQNEAIQAAVRRWTWAAMPLRSYDDGYDPNAVEPSRMARVASRSVTTSKLAPSDSARSARSAAFH
jgi:anti-sigma-K factor RskA